MENEIANNLSLQWDIDLLNRDILNLRNKCKNLWEEVKEIKYKSLDTITFFNSEVRTLTVQKDIVTSKWLKIGSSRIKACIHLGMLRRFTQELTLTHNEKMNIHNEKMDDAKVLLKTHKKL